MAWLTLRRHQLYNYVPFFWANSFIIQLLLFLRSMHKKYSIHPAVWIEKQQTLFYELIQPYKSEKNISSFYLKPYPNTLRNAIFYSTTEIMIINRRIFKFMIYFNVGQINKLYWPFKSHAGEYNEVFTRLLDIRNQRATNKTTMYWVLL